MTIMAKSKMSHLKTLWKSNNPLYMDKQNLSERKGPKSTIGSLDMEMNMLETIGKRLPKMGIFQKTDLTILINYQSVILRHPL
jgi:hypothetical protein